MGIRDGSEVKNPPANAGDVDSVPGSGRSPGERNGNPLQYSYQDSPMDRGTCRATVHEVAKQDWATNHHHHQIHLKNFTETLLYVKVGKDD